MAIKKVTINSGVRAAPSHTTARAGKAVTPGDDPNAGDDPIDVSHLRPLSEGVLRAVGWHMGVDREGGVRDLRGTLNDAWDLDPFELPSDELHVQWARLEHAHQGVIERNGNADGSVVLRFTHGDGDSTTGSGASTREAFEALSTKMHKLEGLK